MRTEKAGWAPRERALLALCVAALGVAIAAHFDLGGSAGAAPGDRGLGSSVSSGEIRNNTIRPADVRRLTASDIGVYGRYGRFAIRVNPGGFPAYEVANCDEGDLALNGGFDAPDGIVLIAFGPTDVRAPLDDRDTWRFGFVNTTNAPLFVSHTEVMCMND